MNPSLSPQMFHILLALSDEERHGYGIMQAVLAHTEGAMRLGAGTLYGNLKRMLEAGWIAESGERPDPALDDERRRYYRLSETGHKVLQAEAQRLSKLVQLAQAKHILKPQAEV